MVESENDRQAELVRETFQQTLLPMKSYHKYTQELQDKGQSCDITREACELHDRATELLGKGNPTVEYQPRYVTFAPADVTQVIYLNLIGKLMITAEDEPGAM